MKHFNCMGCGHSVNYEALEIKAHNGYCGLCDTCYQNGVLSSEGLFTPSHFQERQAKKSASHGCRVWWVAKNLNTEEKAQVFANYPVARLGGWYISNAKVGTWQLSKVADEIGTNRIEANVFKDGYTLTADTDTVISAVREISSNHGNITPKIISKYGFRKTR